MKDIVFGLNPYGLTYHLGLQGMGGPRANPQGGGLPSFLALGRELGAKAMEIFDPWLRAMSDAPLAALRARLDEERVTPIVSWGLTMGPFDSALTTIRCGLTSVLCGDRAALAIENHQDFASEELVGFARPFAGSASASMRATRSRWLKRRWIFTPASRSMCAMST